jgi:hypothetical protein
MIRLNRHLTSTVSRLARPRVGVTSDNMIIGTVSKQVYSVYTFVCSFSNFGGFPSGAQQALNAVGILSVSLLVRQKQPIQNPTREETSSSISNSCTLTDNAPSTEILKLKY